MDYSGYIALENHIIGFDVYETTLYAENVGLV